MSAERSHESWSLGPPCWPRPGQRDHMFATLTSSTQSDLHMKGWTLSSVDLLQACAQRHGTISMEIEGMPAHTYPAWTHSSGILPAERAQRRQLPVMTYIRESCSNTKPLWSQTQPAGFHRICLPRSPVKQWHTNNALPWKVVAC